MNAKFETAIFIDGNERKSYSTDEIAKIFNEISTYTYVKEHLYCPFCEKAKLVHHYTNKRNYLSRHPLSSHVNCSIVDEVVPHTYLTEMMERPRNYDIKSRLNRLLDKLYLAQNGPSQNDPTSIILHSISPDGQQKTIKTTKRYRIPCKHIAINNRIEDFLGPKMFYGKVMVKWLPYPQDRPTVFYMHIHHPDTQKLVCSLSFRPDLYSALDNKYKQSQFDTAIAFFTELQPKEKNNNTFFNGKIDDLEKIALYII